MLGTKFSTWYAKIGYNFNILNKNMPYDHTTLQIMTINIKLKESIGHGHNG